MASSGCGGVNGELVDIICTCEHCDDWKEDELRASLDAQSDVSDVYACDIEYEALAVCQIDRGECDDEAASWSSRDPGSCNGTMDTGLPCTTGGNECAALGATCNGATCVSKVCAGGSQPCSSDGDCSGEDQCADELKDWAECIDDGSEHRGPGFDFD